MADAARPSSKGAIACIALSVLALFFWIILLPSLASLTGSDPAGNAMAQGFTALGLIILWLLLAVLFLVSWSSGAPPKLAAVAGLILIPASGVATFMAMDLLTRPRLPPHLVPIIIPALVPPLIIAFVLWAVLPSLRAAVPARVGAGAVWGAVLVLSLAIVPMSLVRNRADDAVAAQLAKYDADYARLPASAGLAELAPFLDTRNEVKREEVIARMRAVPQRQREAEAMLARGDLPLGWLGRLDLEPTPALCTGARAALMRRAQQLTAKNPGTRSINVVAADVIDAVGAMTWLVGYDCACDAETRAWETMAAGYQGTTYDVMRLAQLREPAELGRTLRENPSRFAMLTPKAHLKAWLKFADEPATRTQALAGARALDHRTADAVEVFNDKYEEGARWQVMKYLPVLDLEPSAPLCRAALAQVRETFGKTYKPKPDDPRSYDELLSRLGASEPLTALLWLAGKGCPADAELAEAESFVRAYRDSPASRAMLAELAKAKKAP